MGGVGTGPRGDAPDEGRVGEDSFRSKLALSSYILTATALRDLKAIWRYIGDDSSRHADLVEDAVLATCRSAAAMPGLGHKREGVRRPDVLFLAVADYERYSIAYLANSQPLRVLRVVHGGRCRGCFGNSPNVQRFLSRTSAIVLLGED